MTALACNCCLLFLLFTLISADVHVTKDFIRIDTFRKHHVPDNWSPQMSKELEDVLEDLPDGGKMLGANSNYGVAQIDRTFSSPVAYFTVGTPARTFLLVIDTGSSSTLIPGPYCSNCQASRIYDPSQSSTAKKMDCGGSLAYPNAICFQCETWKFASCSHKLNYAGASCSECDMLTAYAEKSGLVGTIYTDTITLGNMTVQNSILGAIDDMNPPGRWAQLNTDGIWGLGGSILQFHWPTTLDGIWSAAGLPRMFGIYNGAIDTCGGAISIGGIDPEMYEGKLWETPMGFHEGHYSVHMESLKWTVPTGTPHGNISKIAPSSWTSKPAILDSGTSLAYIGKETWNLLQTQALAMTPPDGLSYWNSLWDATNTEHLIFPPSSWVPPASWPSLTITVSGGYQILFAPDQYCIAMPMKFGGHAYTLGLVPPDSDVASIPILLGDTFLANTYWVFDLDNMKVRLAHKNHNRPAPPCPPKPTTNNDPYSPLPSRPPMYPGGAADDWSDSGNNDWSDSGDTDNNDDWGINFHSWWVFAIIGAAVVLVLVVIVVVAVTVIKKSGSPPRQTAGNALYGQGQGQSFAGNSSGRQTGPNYQRL
eukprot:TRINITY_DN103962_c0_g1_i1.p1 TRINITY_DN103962_c0_g1~~TRINITY_DN103962_c0_g1_i1.p1  ORF type:complete len:603 (-),score=54.16 TRINITY_DN103962_c0_g1_i1:148-1926(-)